MEKKYIRYIRVFGDQFIEFKKTLPRDVLKKLYQVFILIMSVEIVPAKFLRPIKSAKGLYEIRVEEGGNTFRIFCCFDDQRIILFNVIQKKTQKTPKDAIDKAQALMRQYFNEKKEQKHDI